jgi:hypothetical protein
MSALGIASVGLGLAGQFLSPTTVTLGEVPLGGLGSLPVVGGLISAVQGLLGGGSAPAGVRFDGMASPESMTFGGDQMMQVHKLPGGGRVVDVFGRDDEDIEWGGKFFGPNALANARAVDAIRISGRQVPLAWADFHFNVVVKKFHAEYTRGGAVIPYKITVVIASLPPPSKPSLLATIKSDLNAALNVAQQVSSVVTTVTNVTTALGSGGSLPKSSPLYPTTVSGVQAAQAAAATAQKSADAQLTAIKASPTAGTMNAAAAAKAFAAQQQSAGATVAGAYLGRAANNLGAS